MEGVEVLMRIHKTSFTNHMRVYECGEPPFSFPGKSKSFSVSTMPCFVCRDKMRKAVIIIFFFLSLIFPHNSETVHILLPLRTSLNKHYYKSIKMEFTKTNFEALIANPAVANTMKDALFANSPLQATGMKDDEVDVGFGSVRIDSLLLFACCHFVI
jgi:hypothetical protein